MTKTSRPNVRNNRYVVGERVYLKRRIPGVALSGKIVEVGKDRIGGRYVQLSMADGSTRFESTSDVCRTLAKKKTRWAESERQGTGRRYWFNNFAVMRAFAEEKKTAGYFVAIDNSSVWVSNGKKRTTEINEQQAGIDTMDLHGGRR